MNAKTNKDARKSYRKIPNDWARFDPDEPMDIPQEFSNGFYKSVYFSPRHATLCYQATRMVAQFGKYSWNETLSSLKNKIDQLSIEDIKIR